MAYLGPLAPFEEALWVPLEADPLWAEDECLPQKSSLILALHILPLAG